MINLLLQCLVNGVAVAVGLFVLWSFLGRMRELPASQRAGAAVIAGVISAVATFVITTIVFVLTGSGAAA